MTTKGSHRILFIGLPSTGKTSYLAALWFMVNQSTIACKLKLKKLDGSSKYLNAIREAWLAYRPVTRNLSDSENQVSMSLEDSQGGEVALMVPDLSGESYRLQWSGRQLTRSYDDHLRKASGAIVFVHPDCIVKANRIDMVDDLVEAQQELPGTSGTPSPASPANKPWDIEKAPTQVQLVELLQSISSRDYFKPPFRIAVVISAWDLLLALDQTPEKWLTDQLPLLRQFLTSNSALFERAIYGVSAQGGKYPSSLFSGDDFKDGKAFATRLTERTDPVSAWLWDQCDEPSRELLSGLNENTSLEELQTSLIRELNKVLSKPTLYTPERFDGVLLRTETSNSIKVKTIQMGEETIRLNRLLLEDAYPTEVSRERAVDSKMAELQGKLPARRVLLVGSQVKHENDITEPLQWLME